MYKRTGKNYLYSLLAIAAGGAVTHSMAPPTPGPLAMAENLHFDVGMMIIVGAAVGLPASIVGLPLRAGLRPRPQGPHPGDSGQRGSPSAG